MEWVIKLTWFERERRNRTIPTIRTTAIDEKSMSRLRKMKVSRPLVARVGAAAELEDSARRGGLTASVLERTPEEGDDAEKDDGADASGLPGGGSEVELVVGGAWLAF